jgi:hypothetical protein
MPYASEAQRKYLHANEPEVAAKWDAEEKGMTPSKKNKQKATASAMRKPVNQDGKRKASGSTSSAGSSIGGGTAASSS